MGCRRAHRAEPRSLRETLPERVTFGLSCDDSGGKAEAGGGKWRRDSVPGSEDRVHKGLEV